MSQKKILFILPGWGGSKKTWEGFVSFLSSHIPDVDVHVLDLPCFGETSCPTDVWGVKEYAKFVKNKMSHIKGDRVMILGHSFGGQVAAYLVAHHPEVCERLILSGAAIYRPKRYIKRTLFGIVAKVFAFILTLPILKNRARHIKKIAYRCLGSSDYEESRGVKREIYKKVVREDVSDILGKIIVHTDIVWGEKDRHTPLRYGKKIAEEIPNAQLHIVEGGTHGLHLHKKKAFVDILQNILL